LEGATISKKIALVTGGNRGLGYEFCRQLAAKGYNVLLTARDSEEGKNATETLRSQGYDVSFFPLSVDNENEIKQAVSLVEKTYGKIDLIVNNAGVNPDSDGYNFDKNVYLGDLDSEEFLSMVRVNSLGPILTIKHFQHLLAKAEEPKVLNITSWMGSIGNRKKGGNYSYCASKAALNMMTKLSAFDLREKNIIAICANPSSVKTRMGGENAQFTPEESVSKLLIILDKVTIEDSGRFYHIDGTVHEW